MDLCNICRAILASVIFDKSCSIHVFAGKPFVFSVFLLDLLPPTKIIYLVFPKKNYFIAI